MNYRNEQFLSEASAMYRTLNDEEFGRFMRAAMGQPSRPSGPIQRKALTWACGQIPLGSMSQRLALIAVAFFADDFGRYVVDEYELEGFMSCNVGIVRRALATLQAIGLVCSQDGGRSLTINFEWSDKDTRQGKDAA